MKGETSIGQLPIMAVGISHVGKGVQGKSQKASRNKSPESGSMLCAIRGRWRYLSPHSICIDPWPPGLGLGAQRAAQSHAYRFPAG